MVRLKESNGLIYLLVKIGMSKRRYSRAEFTLGIRYPSVRMKKDALLIFLEDFQE